MTTKEIKENIEKALEEIRPFLKSDGGDITLVSVENDKIANVRLEGACGDCSLRYSTVRAGVETTIKKYVPQIEQVVDLTSY